MLYCVEFETQQRTLNLAIALKKKQTDPNEKPPGAAIFAKTFKRKPEREYKSNSDVMQFRVDTINKKLQSAEGLDGLDELVSGGKKSHGPCWLIGRHDVKCVKASTQSTAPPAPTDSYIQELTIAYKLLYCLSTCMF
ncbi:hypothetical protein POM88_000785 [Heracleum sosnowskyi]|uniref:Uncharacterized protein n=1 Tax=Heracleum sosnowskyi TaxID=360622 RepID=A0AAD8JAY6_9APIA|nr:hypothetical protein POM88_000785 [Heracleum sosnowskyi]